MPSHPRSASRGEERTTSEPAVPGYCYRGDHLKLDDRNSGRI